MLSFRDFFHLPQLDTLIERMLSEPSGLTVIAGLDARPETAGFPGRGFPPSGRQALFGIYLDAILGKHPKLKCTVVTRDKTVVRVQRPFRRRVTVDLIQPPDGYAERIEAAIPARPATNLLVIDRLTPESAGPALEAVRQGVPVLSQLDTVFRGAEALRQLAEMGGDPEDLAAACWVLSVQRMRALCPNCREEIATDPALLDRLRAHPFIGEATLAAVPYYQAKGCARCNQTGRFGEVATFDVYRSDGTGTQPSRAGTSLLSLETYLSELVRSGHLPPEDLLDFEPEQFRRTFDLFQRTERAFRETRTDLESRVVQLEAAHRVLQQRTEALVTLQTIGQSMIASDDLHDLARHLCRYACQLCAADRAILYHQGSAGSVEVLAVDGWAPALLSQRVKMDLILDAGVGPEPSAFDRLPPGVPPAYTEGRPLGAGLAVSLYIQHEWVGLMILHAEEKGRFSPRETALLQTFANQAALAIQRAGLVEQLRAKIEQLEAAQEGLAQKERLEHEMELARQVQEGLLPRVFPDAPGLRFEARCEPARQVGGDFYDAIPLEGGAVGVAIADVSDKGMPAALFMSLAGALLRAEARRERSPARVLRAVNRLLRELGEHSLFVTLFYGVIEPGARRLTYARAGHEYPYLLRDGELKPLGGEGIALGLVGDEEFRLSEEKVELREGDRLVLYTDGLTDVFDEAGRIFDRERLEELLKECEAGEPEAMCAFVFDRLRRYRGEAEPFDDMTMLVVGVGKVM